MTHSTERMDPDVFEAMARGDPRDWHWSVANALRAEARRARASEQENLGIAAELGKQLQDARAEEERLRAELHAVKTKADGEIRALNYDPAALRAEADSLRALLREAGEALRELDAEACSSNISTHDGWSTTAPFLEINAKTRARVADAIAAIESLQPKSDPPTPGEKP